MLEKIIIAGAGGQGIMLLGKILAEAAMRDNKAVTWIPSYGAEVRGGAAYCMVIISDTLIGSPFINEADTLIAMNEPGLDRFRPRLKRSGLLLANSSLITRKLRNSEHVLSYPFTDMACRLGNVRVANMVALGAYIARKKTTGFKMVLRIIEEIAPPDKRALIGINKEALSSGKELMVRRISFAHHQSRASQARRGIDPW